MDFVKNAVSKASGGGDSSSKDNNSGGQKQDYVDKAWDTASKKAGYDFSPETDEKITDGARSAYEKYTGKNVPDKVSN